MNLELFIAKRIYFGKQKGEKRVSAPAIKIAVAGVAIGLTAMILAVSIVVGFKKEVRNKVIGFGSHIQVTNLGNSNLYETLPICVDSGLLQKLTSIDGVKHSDIFATKSGVIKTDDAFQGIVVKGVDSTYDWDFFKQNIVEGSIINYNDTSGVNQAIISKSISNKLKLKVGDEFITYFIQEPIRARKFVISGIYNTNFEDYDKLFIIADLNLLRKINDWESDQVSGIELKVNNFDDVDGISHRVFLEMMPYRDRMDNTLFTRSVKDLNPMIFNWLDLLDMNVAVIIILMFSISIFTMISGLLIIILERTNMIGILKVMGAKNYSIRKTFLYVSSFLVVKGMVIGNIVAFIVIALQVNFGLIQLNPENYYVSEMPVDVNWGYFLMINIGTLTMSILMMVAPSYLIAKISPAKSIKFD